MVEKPLQQETFGLKSGNPFRSTGVIAVRNMSNSIANNFGARGGEECRNAVTIDCSIDHTLPVNNSPEGWGSRGTCSTRNEKSLCDTTSVA